MIPQIDVEITDTDSLEITVFPKGFGSENNNALLMGSPVMELRGLRTSL